VVRRIEQRVDYPLQLMLDLFEFPEGRRVPAAYPKYGTIHEVVAVG
jgi:hypothetical protein